MDFGDILNQWGDMQKGSAKGKKAASSGSGSASGTASSGSWKDSRKKANAPTAEEKARAAAKVTLTPEEQMARDSKKAINPMELWLRRYSTTDKDAIADQYEEERHLNSREYLRTMAPEARIDLHGLTRDEAEARLNGFVADCQRKGLRKILIVHGKGNHSHGSDPVLGPMVRQFIEHDKRLGTSGHPDHNHGGTGATWVIIK